MCPDLYLHPYTKINSTLILSLHVKDQTVTPLINRVECLYDLGASQNLLISTQKVLTIKNKTDKLNLSLK